MRRRGWVQLAVLAVVFGVLAVPLAPAKAAFPYKFTLSGPGLKPASVEVWMADNSALLKTMQDGLLSAQPGIPLTRTGVTYHLNWWWGTCWATATPCTTDPAGATALHTLYFFDLLGHHGYLKYIDQPDFLPSQVSSEWLQMPAEFDLQMQRVVADHSDPAFLSLWVTCRLNVQQDIQSGNTP